MLEGSWGGGNNFPLCVISGCACNKGNKVSISNLIINVLMGGGSYSIFEGKP